jgi:hypothetical protein
MKKKKESRGGSREGSGRPKKEETKTLAYRVPAANAAALNEAIKKLIADFISK